MGGEYDILRLRPAGDFATSGVEPSDSTPSTFSFCEPLSLLCEALENNDA
jgi:hypothetical protein